MPIVHIQIKGHEAPIELTLDAQKAPDTVANFLAYVKEGFYDSLLVHRVIAHFVIQAGGYENVANKMRERPATREPIALEYTGLKNAKYTLAMARMSNPNSATSQFFINLTDNHFLDTCSDTLGYAVFGHVSAGFEVVDALAKMRTRRVSHFDDVPQEPIVMEKVTLVQE